MAGYNFQKQVAGMKKLRSMLEKNLKYSKSELQMYNLLGGEASTEGVESSIRHALSQLDRMIKDCEGRIRHPEMQ